MPRLRSLYNRYYSPDISTDIEDLAGDINLVEDYQEIESLD